jgi:hypothetical protein
MGIERLCARSAHIFNLPAISATPARSGPHPLRGCGVGAGAVPLPAGGINKNARRRIFREKCLAPVFFSSPVSLSLDLRRVYL